MRPHIRFLGTGNAVCLDGRGQAATWFEDDSGALLVDCGPSFMAHAQRFGVDLERLRAVAITHFHGDHLAGLPFLLMYYQSIARRTQTLELLGPVGLRNHLDALCALMYDRWGLPFDLRVHEWDPEGGLATWDNTHWRITPYSMQHKPESLGFRLQTAATTVAFSGDTVLCPALYELARGADVLVVECTLPTPIVPIHIHARELVDALPALGARRVAAIHTDDATAAVAAEAGSLPPDLSFPDDGEVWEL
ncbi:ribonuclease Z [Myxococcota bacterium]|nr:ribonuclease Z [Myxococcota bacterium]MBU1511177.1 ribonuclease Z [Myxococcota bacterium]